MQSSRAWQGELRELAVGVVGPQLGFWSCDVELAGDYSPAVAAAAPTAPKCPRPHGTHSDVRGLTLTSLRPKCDSNLQPGFHQGSPEGPLKLRGEELKDLPSLSRPKQGQAIT
ncbi:hypothetical protein JZ751_020699 [Albula glossodonta]|uniref:Uncharacterized protein n=1 Tax=Albula glossodonta TaxID=121402 RepID=A0A8T2PKC9_9TELE|nr:hypothetical protein JZ751_020699 [Albula glossodonta]